MRCVASLVEGPDRVDPIPTPVGPGGVAAGSGAAGAALLISRRKIGRSVRIRKEVVTVGRLPECDVVVADPGASGGMHRYGTRTGATSSPTWARRTGPWSTTSSSTAPGRSSRVTASPSGTRCSSSGRADVAVRPDADEVRAAGAPLSLRLAVPEDGGVRTLRSALVRRHPCRPHRVGTAGSRVQAPGLGPPTTS